MTEEEVTAPLAGTVLSLEVEPGDEVKAGDVLLKLEAMKMENEIVSPKNGVVKEVKVSKDQSVKANDVLIVLE